MTPEGYDFSGRVAIVTGGASGIGAATALLLARYGADIIIADVAQETMDQRSAAIEAATKRRCLAVPTDVRDEDQVERLIVRTIKEFGHIDILINNAGRSDPAPLRTITTEKWKNDFALNVDAALYCSREAGRHFMEQQRPGAIVNVSSGAGMYGVKGRAGYSSAKAALQMFTKVAAAEWGPHGIRVNCVVPGLIATENAKAFWEAAKMDLDALGADRPLHRPGKPEEVASAIVFLASDAASYITGEILVIDGGPQIGGAGD